MPLRQKRATRRCVALSIYPLTFCRFAATSIPRAKANPIAKQISETVAVSGSSSVTGRIFSDDATTNPSTTRKVAA